MSITITDVVPLLVALVGSLVEAGGIPMLDEIMEELPVVG